MMVSVVVIGRNEGERLRQCLLSVQRMERSGFTTELIYVDSGSQDGSVALAQSLGARAIALHPELPTAALGRNAGWRAAQGEFVLFLDGDTVLAPDFVAEALPEFADAAVAVLWGHRREMHPERSWYNRVLDLDWIYAPGPAAFCGGDALFRRELLELTGGFDDTLIAGEEPELCRRIIARGGIILHVDRAMTGHDLAMTRFRQYWRRARRAGHAYAEVSGRFRADGTGFWGDVVRANRVRAVGLVGYVGLGVLLSVLLRSWWPFAGLLVGLAILVGRTAWKARWKSDDWATLIGYGVHSWFQQLPIFVGQLGYRWDQRRGAQRGLLEYKR